MTKQSLQNLFWLFVLFLYCMFLFLAQNEKDEIIEIIKEAQNRMRLNNWDILIKFEKEDKSEERTGMDVGCDYKYLTANITIYEKVIKKSWEDRRLFIFHEFSHILSTELVDCCLKKFITKDEIFDAWERLAESIARIVLDKDSLIINK